MPFAGSSTFVTTNFTCIVASEMYFVMVNNLSSTFVRVALRRSRPWEHHQFQAHRCSRRLQIHRRVHPHMISFKIIAAIAE